MEALAISFPCIIIPRMEALRRVAKGEMMAAHSPANCDFAKGRVKSYYPGGDSDV